jgi:hypothetical protein
VGLIFKGSGFYLTDYKKPANSSEAKAEDGAKPPAGGEKTESGKPKPASENTSDKSAGEGAKKSSKTDPPSPSKGEERR